MANSIPSFCVDDIPGLLPRQLFCYLARIQLICSSHVSFRRLGDWFILRHLRDSFTKRSRLHYLCIYVYRSLALRSLLLRFLSTAKQNLIYCRDRNDRGLACIADLSYFIGLL